MKNLGKIIIFSFICLAIAITGCKKKFEEYPTNPNLPGDEGVIPPEYLLRTILHDIHLGGGVSDGLSGNVPEQVFQQISRWSQYQSGLISPLYGGTNQYNWTNTVSSYGIIRNANQLELQAINAYGETGNPYLPIVKFCKAYAYIWLTQRVGDIPMSEAGMGVENPTPKFDKQVDVYEQCLKLLEEANSELAAIAGSSSTSLSGDIYYNGDLEAWRRAINAYQLRVLISLSKRADDTPDLRIKQRFTSIISNSSEFPLFESNSDNFEFKWVPVVNRPDVQFRSLYAVETTVASTILDITTSTEDPRTFVFATPAPAELEGGKNIDDFTAYVGSPQGTPQGTLFSNADVGMYSYPNYLRYLDGTIDNYPENKRIIDYSEMCFNIAEGIHRGWAAGSVEDWYNKGIEASLAFFGVEDGSELTIGGVVGDVYGTVTADVSSFLNNPNLVYQGGDTGLKQILEQKYVAFWQTGSWEPYYNWRRTGFPVFDVGPGTNAQGQIPLRWQYEPAEVQNNPNASQAISEQFGSDDIFAKMWLIED